MFIFIAIDMYIFIYIHIIHTFLHITQWCPQTIAKLVNITPITSFMMLRTVVVDGI